MKYLYHGTSTTRLREILKKGLIGNPKQRVFSDKNVVDYKVETAGRGVYLTPKCPYALSSAGRAVDKLGGNRAIIVVKYNPKRTTFLIDEDDLRYTLEGAIVSAMRVSTIDNPVVLEGILATDSTLRNYQNKTFRKAYGIFLKWFRKLRDLPPQALPKLNKDKSLYKDFVTAVRLLLIRSAYEYANLGDWQTIELANKLPELFKNGKPNATKEQVNRAYLKALLKLGKHLRKVVALELRSRSDSSETSGGTSIILPYVGFKGKARIVAIIAAISESLDEGYKYKVLYNKDPKAVALVKKCIRMTASRDAEFV